jgi:hypothetical protein
MRTVTLAIIRPLTWVFSNHRILPTDHREIPMRTDAGIDDTDRP